MRVREVLAGSVALWLCRRLSALPGALLSQVLARAGSIWPVQHHTRVRHGLRGQQAHGPRGAAGRQSAGEQPTQREPPPDTTPSRAALCQRVWTVSRTLAALTPGWARWLLARHPPSVPQHYARWGPRRRHVPALHTLGALGIMLLLLTRSVYAVQITGSASV